MVSPAPNPRSTRLNNERLFRRHGEKLTHALPLPRSIRISEKFLSWSDTDTSPSLELILSNITLYWLTGTSSTSLYHYRTSYGRESDVDKSKLFKKLMDKPVGYSLFPKEILPTPIEWVKGRVNLVWSRRHDSVSRSPSPSDSEVRSG